MVSNKIDLVVSKIAAESQVMGRYCLAAWFESYNGGTEYNIGK